MSKKISVPFFTGAKQLTLHTCADNQQALNLKKKEALQRSLHQSIFCIRANRQGKFKLQLGLLLEIVN